MRPLLLGLALLLVVGTARPCRASGSLRGAEVLAHLLVLGSVVPAALIDIGFAGYDIDKAARGLPPSRDVAIAEVVLMAPQIIISLSAMSATLRNESEYGSRDRYTKFLLGSFGATGIASTGLLAHGVWALAQRQPVNLNLTSAPNASVQGALWSVSPALLPRGIGLLLSHPL